MVAWEVQAALQEPTCKRPLNPPLKRDAGQKPSETSKRIRRLVSGCHTLFQPKADDSHLGRRCTYAGLVTTYTANRKLELQQMNLAASFFAAFDAIGLLSIN